VEAEIAGPAGTARNLVAVVGVTFSSFSFSLKIGIVYESGRVKNEREYFCWPNAKERRLRRN